MPRTAALAARGKAGTPDKALLTTQRPRPLQVRRPDEPDIGPYPTILFIRCCCLDFISITGTELGCLTQVRECIGPAGNFSAVELVDWLSRRLMMIASQTVSGGDDRNDCIACVPCRGTRIIVETERPSVLRWTLGGSMLGAGGRAFVGLPGMGKSGKRACLIDLLWLVLIVAMMGVRLTCVSYLHELEAKGARAARASLPLCFRRHRGLVVLVCPLRLRVPSCPSPARSEV